jgi:hypothetical protein
VQLVFVLPHRLAMSGVTATIIAPCALWLAAERLAPAQTGTRRRAALETTTRCGQAIELSVLEAGDRLRVIARVHVFDRVGAVVLDELAAGDDWRAEVLAAIEGIEIVFDPDPPLAIRKWWSLP